VTGIRSAFMDIQHVINQYQVISLPFKGNRYLLINRPAER
ncbi:MAG: hypothetical protein ACI9FJ_003216, partial [Alteromonadaceae bacterium]